jgi:hypothetical protein
MLEDMVKANLFDGAMRISQSSYIGVEVGNAGFLNGMRRRWEVYVAVTV